jgi:hypothetical protein
MFFDFLILLLGIAILWFIFKLICALELTVYVLTVEIKCTELIKG